MPEFQLDYGGRNGDDWFRSLDSFTQGYVEAMFFTSTGSGDDGEMENATVSDLSQEARKCIIADCRAFQECSAYKSWLQTMEDENWNGPGDPSETHAGRDFWYTRNGHGVGFWEGESDGYPAPHDNALDNAAKAFGETDLYNGRKRLYLTMPHKNPFKDEKK